MEGEKILLSQRQLQRWHLIKMVEVGKITLKEAGEKIGVCYRQAKRIRRALRQKGIRGLIHGNTGRPSHHRLSEVLRQRVLQLSKEVYPDFNDTHFTEKLGEEEGMVLSRETVRRIRRGARIEPKRRRRGKRHRKRRERMAQEGWMVLWDGSPHLWFGEGNPPCSLMAAMDDARGTLLAAQFFPFEGTVGYFWLLKEMVKRYGIDISKEPMLVYPTLHYQNGGLEYNSKCETSVPGFFSAGEVSGGVHGENRLMGNSLLDVCVFGRIAGVSASDYPIFSMNVLAAFI